MSFLAIAEIAICFLSSGIYLQQTKVTGYLV